MKNKTCYLLHSIVIGVVCVNLSYLSNAHASIDELERELELLDSMIEGQQDSAEASGVPASTLEYIATEPEPEYQYTPTLRSEPTYTPPQAAPVYEPKVEPTYTPPVASKQKAPVYQAAATSETSPRRSHDELTQSIDALDQEIGQRINVRGNYRMAAGVGRNRSFSLNDSNPELQDRNSNYLFGERLNNTYDPAIYSNYSVELDAQLSKHVSVYSHIVADPWSWVGKTDEFKVTEAGGLDSVNVQLKYWGANDSTIDEIYRADLRNQIAFEGREINDGKTQQFTVKGINDQNLTYIVPPHEIDFEFRPLRKLWLDYEQDDWHTRVFTLANQEQAYTSDDPLMLSNNKDFWQPSPWLSKWIPIKRFAHDATDPDINGSIQRGHYSDSEAFNAKTSYGEYLTLLRGVSFEKDFGRTYLGGMMASPYGPWDEYQEFNNVSSVMRMKHQVTPQWMVGAVYTSRIALIDREPDAFNQVLSLDTNYYLNNELELYAQAAGSRDEIDRLSQGTGRSPHGFISDVEGQAFRSGMRGEVNPGTGPTRYFADFTWMDTDFRPQLSRYASTRDDNFWGKHITFHEYSPDLEYFRVGTGVDIGRFSSRLHFDTELQDGRGKNLLDLRHVRDADTFSFIENVVRDEITLELAPGLKAKGFSRWVLLPETQTDVEPYLTDFVFIDQINSATPDLQNLAIDPGKDPSRFTIAGGLQYSPTNQWTFEGSYTRTNDIPDFPRALQNDVFLNAAKPDPDTPNIFIDDVQNFLYNQEIYGLPPYDYFSIIKERVVFEPRDGLRFTFHAAQNSYKLWGPIDEMMTHQGLSLDYAFNNDVSLFMDYTHAVIADVPHGIGASFKELPIRDHHNIYANVLYRMNPETNLKVEYGVIGPSVYFGSSASPINPYAVSEFSLATLDTEHIWRVSLEGTF